MDINFPLSSSLNHSSLCFYEFDYFRYLIEVELLFFCNFPLFSPMTLVLYYFLTFLPLHSKSNFFLSFPFFFTFLILSGWIPSRSVIYSLAESILLLNTYRWFLLWWWWLLLFICCRYYILDFQLSLYNCS